MVDWILILIILLALVFDFVNGFHDTANAIATSVMTNAIKVPYAIMMAAGLDFLGAMLSTHVAMTVGKSIVDPLNITQTVLLATLISAITWNLITWKFGLPSSSSHALIGSLMGIVLIQGISLKLTGVRNIILGLLISPVLGLVGGIILMIVFNWSFRNIRVEKVNLWFRKLQLISAGFMSLSHGGNDAQKSMAMITMALFASGALTGEFQVPMWVKIVCALAMACGTATGGWRIIRTVGRGIIELKPIQGCAAETISATIIQCATQIGLPVSTTHVITSAICGVGSAENIYHVNWNVMKNIVLCWFITIPIVAIFGALVFKLITGAAWLLSLI